MASNTTYIPSAYPLDQSKVQGDGQGVAATPAANTTTNIDLSITDDVIITGLQIIITGATAGDSLSLSVLLGGVTVATPVPGPWYVPANGDDMFDLAIPMKIIAGLTLRAVYTNTSLIATPKVEINYRLWKVLV